MTLPPQKNFPVTLLMVNQSSIKNGIKNWTSTHRGPKQYLINQHTAGGGQSNIKLQTCMTTIYKAPQNEDFFQAKMTP